MYSPFTGSVSESSECCSLAASVRRGAYLQKIPLGQQIDCYHPVCKSEGLVLNNIMHFKNYVANIHRISLRV